MKDVFLILSVYAEIRNLSNMRFQEQEELTRAKNRIARWFSIYFPEYKDVYRDLKAVSGRMVLQAAPLPEDIRKLGRNEEGKDPGIGCGAQRWK